jgi:hypothetical protein
MGAPMSDPRLTGEHLEFPRRNQFYSDRADLLAARGPLTSAADDWVINRLFHDPHHRATPPAGTDFPNAGFFLHDWQTGACYPLKLGTNTVGRFANNDIVPPCEDRTRHVSRRHCVVLVHATGGFEVYDTASLNGTFVNGCRLTRAVWLAPRDILQLANWPLQFICPDRSEPRQGDPSTPNLPGDDFHTGVTLAG